MAVRFAATRLINGVVIGIVVLISVPLARVTVSLVLFALRRNKAYPIMAGLVLMILLVTLLLGITL